MDILGWRHYFLRILLAGHTLPSVKSNGREQSLYTIVSGQLQLERGVGARHIRCWVFGQPFKNFVCTLTGSFLLCILKTRIQRSPTEKGADTLCAGSLLKILDVKLLNPLGKSRSAVGANRCHFAKASAKSLKLGNCTRPSKVRQIITAFNEISVHRPLKQQLNYTPSKGQHAIRGCPYRPVLTVDSRHSQILSNNKQHVVCTSRTEGTQTVA